MSLSATMVWWRAGNSPIISDMVCSSRSFCLHFSTSSLLRDHTPSSTEVDNGTKRKKKYHSQNRNGKKHVSVLKEQRVDDTNIKGVSWYTKKVTKMKLYLIGSDRKQRPHARRAFCHRLRAAMALLNVTGIGLSPRWNLQNGTRPAYKRMKKNKWWFITNIACFFLFFTRTVGTRQFYQTTQKFHTQIQTWGEKF